MVRPLALVRLEDVHPLTPPEVLRRFGRALERRGLPYLIALVPFYVHPEDHAFVRISDRPAFAAAVRECAARGATIVLHGSTHQRTGESTSDYEFWDGAAHRPPTRASEADTRERIERALAECRANGIEPLLWETPHYAATDSDYAIFARYFSAAMERRQAHDEEGSDQLLPYIVPRDRFGQLLLPEALGYVPLDDQRAGPILDAARRMLVVRDAVAGFFFHTFCDLAVLEAIVDGMVEMGYRFADPRVLRPTVRATERRAMPGPAATEGDFAIPGWSFPCRPLRGIALRAPGGIDASGLLAEIGAGIRAAPAETILGGIGDANLVVAPPDAVELLGAAAREALLASVRAGAALIAWGEEGLASALDIRRAEETSASRIRDPDYPELEFRIGGARRFSPLQPAAGSTVVCETPAGEAVAATVELGEGKALYCALPLAGPGAISLPFLADVAAREFRLLPIVRAKRIEVYFDPGAREEVAIEDLVREWARISVRTIHAAGWHAYPEWVYEYDRLVELAHENGMLVHLWLALPHVSDRFWRAHPEWRERTATGAEATLQWRPAMALLDEACERAAREEVREILRGAPFDGVTLAELSFGSRAGLEDPSTLTPFHRSAVERFRGEIGFDPRDLLDPASPRFHGEDPAAARAFIDARARAVTDLHRRWLAFLAAEREATGRAFEIVVALHDGLGDPRVRDGLGTDVRAILDLGREIPFSVQILDPGTRRGSERTRFASLERDYAPLIAAGEWIAHVNLAHERPEGIAPEGPDRLAGGPLLETIAQLAPRRVAIYSEDALPDVDKPFLAFAAAGGSEALWMGGSIRIEAPATVRVPMAGRLRERVLLDGAPWRGGSPGEAIVPPGRHEISFGMASEGPFGWIRSGAQLVDASAEILGVEPFARGLRVRYRSGQPVAAVIDEAPVEVVVSGERIPLRSSLGLRGHAVLLPAGDHTAVLYTEGVVGFVVRRASIALSRGIVALSAIALGVVGILFLHGRIRRPSGRRSPIPGGVR